MLGFLTALIGSKGRYVFLRGGGVAGTSEGRVITESEHQKGRVIPLYNVFKNFLMRIFVMLLSIFGIHIRGNVFC